MKNPDFRWRVIRDLLACGMFSSLFLLTVVIGNKVAGDDAAITVSGPETPVAGQPVEESHQIEPSVDPELRMVGTNSCAAASCHGGGRLSEGRSFAAYQIWARRDPHSRAGEVLSNDLSTKIMSLLDPGKSGAPGKAIEDVRCLNCHATTENHQSLSIVPSSHKFADGVGCESCHGPARDWLGMHSTLEWKGLSGATKKSMGFIDTTADLEARVQLCVSCHVGSPGKDVNHDLIAAGHPRLNFEFSAFHANLPKHWDVHASRSAETKDIELDPAFEARAWLIGQLVTAQAAVRLLQDRTRDEHPWPELSEYACFSCHHDLKHDSWYHARRKSTGQFAWGTWNFGTFPALTAEVGGVDEFNRLQNLMEGSFPTREAVRQSGSDLDLALEKAIGQISARDFSVTGLDQLALHLIAHSKVPDDKMPQLPAQSWDQAAQLYLATVAIALAREKMTVNDPRNIAIQNDLEAIRKKLVFGDSSNSPQDHSGSEMDEILLRLKRIEETLARSDTTPR